MKRSWRLPGLPSIWAGQAPLWILVLFTVAVFLLGGGSRDDIYSLVILRPLAAFAALYALLASSKGQFRPFRWLIVWLLALAAIMIAQLIPLPPSIWANLPGHELHAEIAASTGTGSLWYPASLSPSKTLNALVSLIVPFAALLLFAVIPEGGRRLALQLLLLLGVASAVIGLLQLAGPTGGPLYFYRITNERDAVGLFANRNHFAVHLAALIPLAAAFVGTGFGLAPRRDPKKSGVLVDQLIFLMLVALFVLMVLASGSRAGLIAAAVTTLWSVFILRQRDDDLAGRPSGGSRNASFQTRGMPFFAFYPIVFGALAAIAMVVSGRASSIDRVLSDDTNSLRFEVLPTLFDMVGSFFPFGSGFGSFSQVYRQFEPDALLSPQYLNHAHSDWIQIAIEGGLPAIVIFGIAAIAVLARAIGILRNYLKGRAVPNLQLAAFGVIGAIALASLVDYPARVPSIMVTLVFAACAVIQPPENLHAPRRASKQKVRGSR